MSELIAREEEQWIVISDFPDVCKTPIGSSLIPIPYPVTAKLIDSIDTIKQVKINGNPVVVFDESYIKQTLGDEAGIGKGVKSQTVGGKCYPKTHSSTIRAKGKYIVRHNDKFYMNGR